MSAGREGDWMLTSTGGQYWPLDPRPEDVDIHHIATALAKECRFGGACYGHYSVAEHSILVSYVVPPEHALQGLMHDATEAYCKDIPRPLKRGLGAVYAEIEERNWLAICKRFDLNPKMHASVKAADDAVLMAERNQIMPRGGPLWSLPVQPADVQIVGYTWPVAMSMFLTRFNELMRSRP